MQVMRTVVWVILLVGLLLFSFFNWKPVEVTIWDNLVLETKVPALVIVAFLLGLVPMWLLHRGAKWRLTRRIAALEEAQRTQARYDQQNVQDALGKQEAAGPDGNAARNPLTSQDLPPRSETIRPETTLDDDRNV
ncbi:hypothetical protein HME9302_01393 [Alteripontixanthobacter maritimus]|uniref:Lipopolysaccharide assembly protein A domain-containing protein n=1 Tax=Alteripontixanthobacter maritimus TaxID=2161824 RepID=A0A369Q5M5_9SPHN|nr:DUF1049 domain-containing protein [Alteripontixanthobacter maritimus]RDC60193.1 hypothetical protein HME9302_01393 [Alteripontixanthobacter maritimus]